MTNPLSSQASSSAGASVALFALSEAIYGVWAPAKTPAAIVSRLHREIVSVLTTPQTRDRFFATGVEVVASTPQVFAAEIKAESTRLEKVFKSAGIRAE